jgi:hypothetical protein
MPAPPRNPKQSKQGPNRHKCVKNGIMKNGIMKNGIMKNGIIVEHQQQLLEAWHGYFGTRRG